MVKVLGMLVLTTLALSVLLLLLMKKRAGKSRLLRHANTVPLAGPALGCAFLAAVSGWAFFSGMPALPVAGIALSSLLMLAFGMFDDLREHSVALKLILQCAAAGVLYASGIRAQIAGLGVAGNLLVTFLWVLGITNAVNHLDIADGLAAGVVLMIASCLSLIAMLNADMLMMSLALICAALAAGFLLFNFPPASLYLGNSGSHFFGFLLAAISLGISYAPAQRPVALLAPVFVFGFPIFDTVFVSMMRMKKGRSALLKSDDHLNMRLIRMGMSGRRALAAMLVLSAFFCLSGLSLSQASNTAGLLVVAAVVLVAAAVGVRMNSEDAC